MAKRIVAIICALMMLFGSLLTSTLAESPEVPETPEATETGAEAEVMDLPPVSVEPLVEETQEEELQEEDSQQLSKEDAMKENSETNITPESIALESIKSMVISDGHAYFASNNPSGVAVYADPADEEPACVIADESIILYADQAGNGMLHVWFATGNGDVINGWMKASSGDVVLTDAELDGFPFQSMTATVNNASVKLFIAALAESESEKENAGEDEAINMKETPVDIVPEVEEDAEEDLNGTDVPAESKPAQESGEQEAVNEEEENPELTDVAAIEPELESDDISEEIAESEPKQEETEKISEIIPDIIADNATEQSKEDEALAPVEDITVTTGEEEAPVEETPVQETFNEPAETEEMNNEENEEPAADSPAPEAETAASDAGEAPAEEIEEPAADVTVTEEHNEGAASEGLNEESATAEEPAEEVPAAEENPEEEDTVIAAEVEEDNIDALAPDLDYEYDVDKFIEVYAGTPIYYCDGITINGILEENGIMQIEELAEINGEECLVVRFWSDTYGKARVIAWGVIYMEDAHPTFEEDYSEIIKDQINYR